MNQFAPQTEFLERVLQVVQDSDANPLNLDPLLEQNLSLLDDNFIQFIKTWAINKFQIVEPQQKKQIARNIANFSNIICFYPKGKEIINMEIAITGYKESLKVLTYNAFPKKWANIQNNLGNVYTWRIRGEQVENIEAAINAYNEALRFFTKETHRYEWARVQHNLGIAYRNRVRGDKKDNIDKAIKAYNLALEVRTKKKYPNKWVQTQLALAHAYSEQHHQKVDKGIEPDESPGVADFGYDLYFFVIAKLLNNNYLRLFNFYFHTLIEQHQSPLQKAIKACESALEVCSQEEDPYTWGEIHNCLGLAYRDQILGKTAENLQKAIDNFQLALQVFKKETYPEAWARIKNNIGTVYRRLFQEDPAIGIQESTDAYRAALEIYTPEASRKNRSQILFNLGLSYQIASDFIKAYGTFKDSIDIVEYLRNEIVSRKEIDQKNEVDFTFTFKEEEDKKELAENWYILYQYMVEICLKLNNNTEAIEYAERSKTRNLVELILSRDLETIFPSDVVTQLKIYKDEIGTGQKQIQNGEAKNPQDLAKRLQELRQNRNELQNKYLSVGYGFDFNLFQEATLHKNTVIIEWYILYNKIVAFIVSKTGEVKVWQSQPEDLEALENWRVQYLQNYSNQKDQLVNSLGEKLKQLATILHIDEILNQIPEHCKQLILVPHRYLHLLPLHALPLAGDSSLFDRFPKGVSYAPSCQLLQLVQKRERPEFTNLFAVQNPTKDLAYADVEVEVILSYFNTNNVLKQQEATKEAIENVNLNTVHCAHFSCHGEFNPTQPRKSALILANALLDDTSKQPNLNECLTLDDIFTLNLEKCRLLTLSACKTGLIDFLNTSDEYIGLPSGFLYAGASNVVSSLWKADDISTAFLMIRFYQIYQNLEPGLTIAFALNKAQLWLRDATLPKLQKWTSGLKLEEKLAEKIQKELKDLDDLFNPDEQPYQKLYYWAAFCAIAQ